MLRKTAIVIITTGLLFTGTVAQAKGKQGTLAYCQSTKNKIEKYNSLRRQGGSASKMENWRQQRKKYKEKFYSNNCKKWRSKLS